MASAWIDVYPDSEENGWFLIGMFSMPPYVYRALKLRLRAINGEELQEAEITRLSERCGKSEEEGHGFKVRYEEDNKLTVHENLMKLLERELDKEKIHHTEAANDLFRESAKEQERYEEWTRNARRIRDNLDIDPPDLKEADSFFKHISRRFKNRQPYPRQGVSAYHLAFAGSACNFSVPGAGKTTIVYAAFSFLREKKEIVNSLMVVGPPSSFFPWENEYKECFGEEARSKRLRGREEVESALKQGAYCDLYLLSYQSACLGENAIRRFLRSHDKRIMLVLDEAHRIKNPEGAWANALLRLAPEAGARVVLTGTPAPNGYEDILSLYNFIWPRRRLVTFSHGYLRNITLAERDGSMTPSIRKDKEQLIEQIAPYFIRIKKSHLDLPDPKESVIRVEMDESQDAVRRYIELEAQRGAGGDNPLLRAKAIRLLQCSSYLPLLDKPIEEASYGTDSFPEDIKAMVGEYRKDLTPKFSRLLELLRSEVLVHQGADGRAIVWCVFNLTIDALKDYLERNDVAAEVIYGQTPTGEMRDEEPEEDESDELQTREKIIRAMHQEAGPKVLIANIKALGESVSLHKACHHAFFLERDYNAGLFMQAKDRIHRVGLKPADKVRYYYMVSTDSIDEMVHTKLCDKVKRMHELIESEEIPLLNLDVDADSDTGLVKILREYLKQG